MLVFRENRVSVSAHLLVQTLAERLRVVGSDRDALLDVLLRAGELECALADAGSPTAVCLALVTDTFAAAIVNGDALDSGRLAGILAGCDVSSEVKVSPPEGFSYYALHPMQYADLAAKVPLTSSYAVVIGIRNIGTTLSAVVVGALARRGAHAERITVRPTGHPFHRVTNFTPDQISWIERHRESDFFIVDEGPGLSGSSFLSVGEALVRAGVQREQICFLCSHSPQPESLCSHNAAARWSSFRSYAVENNSHIPPEPAVELSGAAWREHVFSDRHAWPGVWTQMERVKFLSDDRKRLVKFEGFGRFGAEVLERNRAIARAGFGTEAVEFHEGFATYPWISGRHGRYTRLSESLLSRLADYCAFRAREFPQCSSNASLGDMLRCNVSEEFGTEAEIDESLLEPNFPIVVDGHMHPHEWLQSEKGVWLKVDGGSHGDDHFYPGPTDIAWDLAGTIVEWQLDRYATEYFLARYRAQSGENPASRLPAFLLAYAAFRMGYCKMAAGSVCDPDERQRLIRDYRRYRAVLQERLPETSFKLQVSGS